MDVLNNTEFRGRKQKIGSLSFTQTGKIAVFLGYCPGCKGKCVARPEEVKEIMRWVGKRSRKPFQRVALRMLRRYTNV